MANAELQAPETFHVASVRRVNDSTVKFSQYGGEDFGILTVPKKFVHEKFLASFRKKMGIIFRTFEQGVTDDAFANPSVRMSPGEQFRVKIFLPRDKVSCEECLTFLENEGGVFLGAQGLALLFKKKYKELPSKFAYYSFDKPENLGVDRKSRPVLPSIRMVRGGSPTFDLIEWGGGQTDGFALVCFIPVASAHH